MPTTKVSVTRDKLDNLANAVNDLTGESVPMTIDEMTDAIEGYTPTITLQTKTVTPTTLQQTVTADTGYDGLSQVTVNQIPSQYIIPSGTINITSNGATDVTNYATANVVVNPPHLDPLDVNFYDYDGTLVYAYSTSDFLALTSMPANPSHSGLTAQGWNWTLSDAKTYVTTNKILEIGQMYVTDDDKSRFYIKIDEAGENVTFFYYQSVANALYIDWGDGSATSSASNTYTGLNRTHVYLTPGYYTIQVTCSSGWWSNGNGSSSSYPMVVASSGKNYSNQYAILDCLKKVELGSAFAFYNANTFYKAYGLESVTIPNTQHNSESYLDVFGNYLFNYCISLNCLVIPNNIKRMGSYNFESSAVEHISFPNSITKIGTGNFYTNNRLKRLTLPDLTENENSQPPQAYLCYSLTDYVFPKKSTITTTGSVCYNAYTLRKVIIPANITTISSSAFYYCRSLLEVHLVSATPPTLDNLNAFYNCACTFYVPSAAVSTYKSATNWNNMSTRIFAEPS